jgi:RNA polymerase sigma-70 factor (ECF subfamily)
LRSGPPLPPAGPGPVPAGGDAPGRNLDASRGFEATAEAPLQALDEDVRLMLAFRAGDAAAFDALFRRWASPLLRYLARMLRDDAAAEDLVQEAFLRVHRARERYTPEARFSTWLYRIATNLALNELRRPRRRERHASPDDEGGPELVAPAVEAEGAVDARRRVGRTLDALDALPEKQRAALCLAALEGLSYAEIAEALELSESAVKALVHRARCALADRLRAGAAGEE